MFIHLSLLGAADVTAAVATTLFLSLPGSFIGSYGFTTIAQAQCHHVTVFATIALGMKPDRLKKMGLQVTLELVSMRQSENLRRFGGGVGHGR